jgi:hypothetical protein
MSTFLASALIASLSLCPKNVTPLQKGEAAPCQGYLFSPEKEQELRLKNENYKLLEQENTIYKKQNSNLNEQINNYEFIIKKEQEKAEKWRSQAERSTEKYLNQQSNSDYYIVGYVLAGVLLTSLSGWSLGQLNK